MTTSQQVSQADLNAIGLSHARVELPEGSQVKGISPYGASYWTRTAEIETEQADGTPRSFFLKV